MLVDTHCHLSFEPMCNNLDPVIKRAKAASVTKIVVPSYDLHSLRQVEKISKRPGVFGAFGIHPWAINAKIDRDELSRVCSANNALAIGEIGLDFKIPKFDRSFQIEALKAQLDVAVQLDLPVLLHCRGAFEELIDILSGYKGEVKGVLHAFSRGPELARRFTDLGLHIAFGGAITHPAAKRPRRSAQVVRLDRILLETDAPSIGLHEVPPEQTEPMHVAEIAKSLAKLRNVSTEEIAAATTKNASELFGFCL